MKAREFLSDLTGAALLPLVGGIVVPAALYLANQEDFEFNRALLAQGAALALAGVALIALLLALVGTRARPRVAALLFGLGAYLALSDILFPCGLGVLNGVPLSAPLPEPWTRDLADLALLAGMLLVACRLPPPLFRRLGPMLVAVLVLSEVAVIAQGLAREREQRRRESGRRPPPAAVHPGASLYLITFDGFSALDFDDRLRAAGCEADLTGFTWYPRHRANYLQTFVSVPSFMTGSLYRDGSMSAWVQAARREGILKELRAAGYAVTTYLPRRGWVHESASYVMLQSQLQVGNWRESARQFWSMVALHLAPHGLHQEVYAALLSAGETTPVRAVALMRRLIADEAGRPARGQCVQAHIMIPHEPFLLDAQARYAPGGGYAAQAEAALRLLAELVAELKRLGRYDDALIVVNADHGWDTIGPASLDAHGLSAAVVAELRELEATRPLFDAHVALNRSHALLLVKLPGDQAAFRADAGRVTQNIDLAATVYDVLGIPAPATDGVSVRAPAAPDRAAHMFTGFQNGLSADSFEHFVFRSDTGLQVAPILVCRP